MGGIRYQRTYTNSEINHMESVEMIAKSSSIQAAASKRCQQKVLDERYPTTTTNDEIDSDSHRVVLLFYKGRHLNSFQSEEKLFYLMRSYKLDPRWEEEVSWH